MKKGWKKAISAAMAAVMLCGLSGCGKGNDGKDAQTSASGTTKANVTETTAAGTSEEAKEPVSQYPDYLNLDSARPIVKEGEKVTLSMLVMRESNAVTDVNNNWFVKFIEEELNIDLDLEEVNLTTFEERRNLMLASDDLKDIIINMRLTANDLVTYGSDGKQLLPMSDYVNEELTPNIVEMLKGQEDAVVENTAPDGKMYTLPNFTASYPGFGDTIGSQRVFIDKKYMEAAGVETVPETLDEFVEMLRAFKKLDPAQMGVKEIFPMVSTWGNDREILQNAFGWIGSQCYLPAWDMETGSVVIPCAQEKYGDYMTLLNTLYSEGLIHPDFFTIDKTAARGLYAEGAVPVLCDAAPYLSVPERFEDYVSAIPLSSKWCENGVTTAGAAYGLGTAVIAADTEYPEVCMRLMDYWYSTEGSVYSTMGCPAGSEDTLGIIGGFSLDENGKIVNNDVVSGKYESDFYYSVNAIEVSQNTPNDDRKKRLYSQELLGVENPSYPELDLTNPDDQYRAICYEAQQGHLEKALPSMYMDVAQAVRFTDLSTVIKNHMEAETAKFVVGQRPLEELNQYFEELKKLGIDEYVELCKDAYADYER